MMLLVFAASTRAPIDRQKQLYHHQHPSISSLFAALLTAASEFDVTVVSVRAGSRTNQWHAGWDVEPRVRVLAVQQAAAGRRPGSRRPRPLRLDRNPRPFCDSWWPKEARLHHGDLHHIQSLHQGLLLADVMVTLHRLPGVLWTLYKYVYINVNMLVRQLNSAKIWFWKHFRGEVGNAVRSSWFIFDHRFQV